MAVARVSASGLADWREILGDLGMDAAKIAPVLADIQEASTIVHQTTLDLSAFVGILEVARRNSGQPGLAWAVGRSAKYAIGGDIGEAVLGSRTLGAALRRLTDFVPIIQDASFLTVDIEQDWTSFGYRILDPDIWPRHEEAMFSLGIYATLIKRAAPDVWDDVEITVEAEQEAVKSDLSQVVNTNVIYGGDLNIIRFPTRTLDCPLNFRSSGEACRHMELLHDLTRKRRSTSVSERVRHLIYRELSYGSVSQDRLARELGMSSRTLRRKLEAEGVSFQSLLDDCRMRFAALEFKARKNVSLSEMALKLGYSEHSNFSRAFSRWAGMAPQDYRRAARSVWE